MKRNRMSAIGALALVGLLGACAAPGSGPSFDDDALDQLAARYFGEAQSDQARLLRGYGIVGALARYGARTIEEHKDADSVQAIADAVVLHDRLKKAKTFFTGLKIQAESAGESSSEALIVTHFRPYARAVGVMRGRGEIVRVVKAAVAPRWREVRGLATGLAAGVLTGGLSGLFVARDDVFTEIGRIYNARRLAKALFDSVGFCVEKVDKIVGGKELTTEQTAAAAVCPDYEIAWQAMDALITTSIDSLERTGEIP